MRPGPLKIFLLSTSKTKDHITLPAAQPGTQVLPPFRSSQDSQIGPMPFSNLTEGLSLRAWEPADEAQQEKKKGLSL